VGLATPNDDACFINIDGTSYSWRDGDALLFDETYLHYARNDAQADRLILMCDVERPTWIVGRIVNFFYMRATVVPNTEEDKRGLVNSIFSRLSPNVARVRTLKQTNPRRYRVIKWATNALALLILAGLLVGAIYAVTWLIGLL
jgi:beta-hydroxylase